jgi:hypothetical protein
MGRGSGSGGGGGKGKGGGGGLTALTAEQQSMKDKIVSMARKTAGTTMAIKPDAADAVIKGGWEGIPNGSVVYRKTVYDSPGNVIYRKVNNNTIVDQNGNRRTLNETQKRNSMGTYAILKVLKQ